jgi:fermentation-respiration switch protein FrsA (DUF1100 family)
MKFRPRKFAMVTGLGIAAGLVVAVLVIRVLENRFIYLPPRYPEGFADPASYGLRLEEVWLTTEDGLRLNAWFLPAPESPNVLLVFHGNADNIGFGLERFRVLARLGVNVMALDYRGYGRSEGTPDEAGIYLDAEAAYRYLTEVRGFQPKHVVLYGHSLGGAVAIQLASRHECGGLIVESSFARGREMARRVFRIPLLGYVLRSRFDSLAKIKQVRCPILIVHGTRDEVVPFSMGQRLYQAAPEPKMFFPIEGAGHSDVFLMGGEKYLECLKALVGTLPAGTVTKKAA